MYNSVSVIVMRQLLIQVLEMLAGPPHTCEIGEMGRKDMLRNGKPALCLTRLTRQSLGHMRAMLNGIEEIGPLSRTRVVWAQKHSRRPSEEPAVTSRTSWGGAKLTRSNESFRAEVCDCIGGRDIPC